jgi:hypothetical protein
MNGYFNTGIMHLKSIYFKCAKNTLENLCVSHVLFGDIFSCLIDYSLKRILGF